jgi:hypothetical protein
MPGCYLINHGDMNIVKFKFTYVFKHVFFKKLFATRRGSSFIPHMFNYYLSSISSVPSPAVEERQ